MCKSEIFAKILRIVSKETEVSEDLILSKCKRSDIVDSRGIMVVILSEYKFSESQISSFTGFTQQSINKLKNIYPDRIRRNYLLKVIVRNIRESLGIILSSFNSHSLYQLQAAQCTLLIQSFQSISATQLYLSLWIVCIGCSDCSARKPCNYHFINYLCNLLLKHI